MIDERLQDCRYALKGRKVLITGAGGGIGYEAAKAFLCMDAAVIIADISREKGSQAVQSLGALYPNSRMEFYEIDLADELQIRRMHSYLIQKYGFIDVVMHNAAVIYIGNVEEISSADWDKSYRVNFRAPLLLTQLFLPQMRSRNAGTIVFVPSSGAAPDMGAYEVFKTAQVELCNTLSGELEGTDVFTYSIGPGLVKTDTAMHGIEMVAQKMGLTTEEFYAMNDSHMLSAREAGCGFAVSVLHAEKYNGQEIGSIQALMDCGLLSVTDSGNSDKAGKAQTDPAMIRKIIQIYKEQYNGWMERNIFERQWVLRDFKKTVGISAGQFQSDMLQQEKELTAESENGFTVYRDHFEKLKRYYQRQYKLLQGYEKNPDKRKEHSDAILSWIRMLDEIL